MARGSHTWTQNRKAFFDGLRPVRDAVIEAKKRCLTFGPPYNVLSVITAAMEAAAEFFTGNRAFYSIGDSGAIGCNGGGGRDV